VRPCESARVGVCYLPPSFPPLMSAGFRRRLLLKNLHLVVGWAGVLEKELTALQPRPPFRLWLTTEPHPNFPNRRRDAADNQLSVGPVFSEKDGLVGLIATPSEGSGIRGTPHSQLRFHPLPSPTALACIALAGTRVLGAAILLRSSLKVTFEAPPGLRKNLLRPGRHQLEGATHRLRIRSPPPPEGLRGRTRCV